MKSESLCLLSLAFVVLAAGCLAAQVGAPERRVENNVVVSERDPAAGVALPKPVQYVGADRWVLYGIADCEVHVFVEADSARKIERLYWVQFESYLPSRPELHHHYDSPRHTTIGGLDFYVDTWVESKDEQTTPGSDLEHIRSLIRAKAYLLPAGMMSVRLVHLMDDKRKELMIIYAEDVAPTGLTTTELGKDGSAHEQWMVIEKNLIQRAKAKIAITKSSRSHLINVRAAL